MNNDLTWWAAGWLAGIAGAALTAVLGGNAILAVFVFVIADYTGRRVVPALLFRQPALIWGGPPRR